MGINVLSLFDGQSCGRQALKELGVEVDNYFASEIDENAITISKYNHDDIIQLGDVENYKEWNLPKIDLLIGGSPCFEAGTKVLTKEGYKNIEDVTTDDYVITHKNRFCKVNKIMSRLSNHYYKLKGLGVPELYLTEEHPLYVLRDNKPQWVKVKDLNFK